MNTCKCGCGKEVKRQWATGHHRLGSTFRLSKATRQKMRTSKLGALNPQFGKVGTMKGRRQSEEAKTKLRAARALQLSTPETKLKISQSLKLAYRTGRRNRKNCPFYIDGRHNGKVPIKQSYEYKLWRQQVFTRDNFICQHCGQRGGELQADHIRPQSVFPELRFELSNGRTLCRPCHKLTPTWGIRIWNNKNITTNVVI